MSRAFRREGVGHEIEVQLAENLWAISVDPQLALEEWLSKQLGATLVHGLMRSHAFQYFAAAAMPSAAATVVLPVPPLPVM